MNHINMNHSFGRVLLRTRVITPIFTLLYFISFNAFSSLDETTFHYGGMIKFDVIFSQYSDAQRAGNVGDDFLVPSTIPVGDGSDKGGIVYDSNAKFSRLWFKTLTQTEVGEIKSYIEMDFNGFNDERLTSQSSNGLRHAFLSWQNSATTSLLAGQTWSTFFNVNALPEAVDFIGPTSGVVFIRQSQFRYTQNFSNSRWMLAFENPSVSLYDAGSGFDSNQVDTSAMPDLVTRYDGNLNFFKYSAAAMVREISYDEGTADDKTLGYAFTLSGSFLFSNNDDIKFMLSQGQLGRYLALNVYRDGAVKADGDIELINSTGGFVAYRHWWTDKIRSTVLYAYSESDNPDSLVDDVTDSVNNSSINLMYSPVKRLTFGMEYMQAQRKLESGTDGDLNRLQFTSTWKF